MKKYIIKNCPCYCEGTAIKGNEKLTQGCDSLHRITKEGKRNLEKCCNIPNCKIKQIAELCNGSLEQETDPLNILEMSFAQKILNLLEIEEVNEE